MGENNCGRQCFSSYFPCCVALPSAVDTFGGLLCRGETSVRILPGTPATFTTRSRSNSAPYAAKWGKRGAGLSLLPELCGGELWRWSWAWDGEEEEMTLSSLV